MKTYIKTRKTTHEDQNKLLCVLQFQETAGNKFETCELS